MEKITVQLINKETGEVIECYKIKQVAEMYGVQRRTVQQWIDKGWLRSILVDGIHRIESSQLDGFERPKPGPRKNHKKEDKEDNG